MTNKYNIFIFCSLFLITSCNSKNSTKNLNENNINIERKSMDININQTRFILVSDEFSVGTSGFKTREITSHYDVSEFLAKLWYLFGKPNSIFYEGYNYTIKDTKTGVIFTADCAGSGPGYGGKREDFKKLESIINDFEILLSNTPLADCEIEFENDFFTAKYGSKDGQPFINLTHEK